MANSNYEVIAPEQTGIVKWFQPAKGYGFIEPDETGADVFLHVTRCVGDYKPVKDDRVRFTLSRDIKRKREYADEVTPE